MMGRYCAALYIWSLVAIVQLCCPSEIDPLGRFAFCLPTAVTIWSMPTPRLFIIIGLASMRTAGGEAPPTNTCPTPSTWASFCDRMESQTSYSRSAVSESDCNARIRIGASAGFTLR